ncbi:MAG TPA: Lrp/AsnC family transcriptional regulator [Clostridiales bacterium]|nr:Lrp/AsnC family transcriptional regulator [Clostridiales bacterium]
MDKLLKLLSENSKLTTGEIAVMLNEPEEYIIKQIKEYEKQGVITGYRAVVNWGKVTDAPATALIELKVTPKRDTGFDEIANKLMSFDEVDTVRLMAGAFDFLVTVKAKTITEIAMFVANKLSTLDSVVSTGTYFMLKTYKDSGVSFDNDESEDDKRSLVL